MNKTKLSNTLYNTLSLSWLTGPIFDKELRVSSRRRRNYTLRTAYIILLTLLMALIWFSIADSFNSSNVFQVSRMSEAGLSIIATIVGFQFAATQLLAVIMLSTAISDEIYHKTLGVLMTTPINGFQIVMGKLFSKLLQLSLLLAISLPLLAVVRVFGGVPWDFIISGLCITITAMIFTGSLSLYFSISGRKSFAVILKTFGTLAILYLAIPALAAWLLSELGVSEITYAPALLYFNPLGSIYMQAGILLSPTGIPFSFYWPIHCLIMLGFSAGLLAISIASVRKVALRQAIGYSDPTSKRKERKHNYNLNQSEDASETTGHIRRISGSPITWKELRAPFIQGGRKKGIIAACVTILALLITYAICANENCLDEDFTHVIFTMIFVIIGLISNAVFSASTITTEKESRSWPILLATPMDDWAILKGKLIGNVRRCLPIWIFMVGHILLFILIGYIHIIALVLMSTLMVTTIFFLSCTGIYFSAKLKRTTSAVVANFALALFLWLIIPILMILVAEIANEHDIFEITIIPNPVVQAIVIMEECGGENNAHKSLGQLSFNWPDSGHKDFSTSMGILLTSMFCYSFVGFIFAWRAKCLFRKKIF